MRVSDSVDSIFGGLRFGFDDLGVDWLSVAVPLNGWAWDTGNLDLRLNILVVVDDFVFRLEKERWFFN